MLKGVYQVDRTEIAKTLIEFLDEISIDNQEVICETLTLFAETALDFVDCILIARHRILGDEVMSFDKKLNNML